MGGVSAKELVELLRPAASFRLQDGLLVIERPPGALVESSVPPYVMLHTDLAPPRAAPGTVLTALTGQEALRLFTFLQRTVGAFEAQAEKEAQERAGLVDKARLYFKDMGGAACQGGGEAPPPPCAAR